MPNSICENQNAPHGNGESEKKADNPTQQVPPAVAKSEVPLSHSKCCDPHKKKRDWFDYGKGVLEIAGLVVLCVYAAYTIKIYCANKKAADAAKSSADTAHDALVRSSRPWIGVIGSPVVLDLRPALDTQLMLAASMTMIVKNYGPSPALYMNIYPDSFISAATDVKSSLDEDRREERAACIMASMAVTEQHSKAFVGDKMEDVTVPPSGRTIFPNEPAKFYFPSGKFNYRDPAELASKAWRIVGCVAYSDQFSTQERPTIHHTLFCYHTPGTVKDFIASQGLVPCNISQNAD